MKILAYLLTLLCVCALAACAQTSSVAERAPTSADMAARTPFDPTSTAEAPAIGGVSGARSATAVQHGIAAATDDGQSIDSAQNIARLDALWRSRTRSLATTDYPIGPGDVIQISVPPIDELSKRVVRVETNGTISLPMLGTLQAGGLTEEQLIAEITRKLKKYMYNPEVDVFVKSYASRQVAVVGSVNDPGLITLTSPNETILEVLTHAGGLSPKAADEVLLIPAGQDSPRALGRVAEVSARGTDTMDGLRKDGARAELHGSAGVAAQKRELAALLSRNSSPMRIALKSSSTLSGGGQYLNMPVRPGDVLIVPGGGEVMVVGWVQNPGHFQVGSGLTVLGAIGAAGGPMYAANTSDIHLIRTRSDGSKISIPINLGKIKDGEEPDLPVIGNDVIDVPYSGIKIGPYVFYQILTKMAVGGPTVPTP